MQVFSRRTLTDQVSDALLKIIVEEEMATGDSLPPAGELARRFDVSTVVVREAVAQLAGRGIVSRRQGREPIVTLPGSEVLAEILLLHGRQERIPSSDFLACRAALEVQAAVLAARRGQESARAAALEPPLEALRAANEPTQIVQADLALHLAIVDLSGNRALRLILLSLVDVISTEITVRTRREDQEQRRRSVRDHAAIVSAIVSGDVSSARRTMAEHFDVALLGVAGSLA